MQTIPQNKQNAYFDGMMLNLRNPRTLVLTRIVSTLAMALSVAAGPAAAQTKADLPRAFTDLSVTMQSRACGELMTGLAMGGVQALKLQQAKSAQGKALSAQRDAVYETGAQAVVLLTMAGSLSLEDRLKAGEAARTIEALAPQVHVDVAHFCSRRVEAWVKAGQVDQQLMADAYSRSRTLLDSILDAKDPNAPR